MKFIHGQDIPYEPASHEDRSAPGVFKKILCTKADLIQGRVQMINWARLPARSSFQLHYHEDMQEIFILIKGCVSMWVEGEETKMMPQDTILVPPMNKHRMTNLVDSDAEYMVLGISTEKGGKTVVV